MLTLNACKLTFMSGSGGDGGGVIAGQARDHCSRQRFNIQQCEINGNFGVSGVKTR